MPVTVYVEIVIFNNLLIDLLLGITTSLCRRRKVKKIRQTLSAIIGTVVAVLYPLAPSVIQIVIKILLAPLLVVIVDKYSSVKDYLVSLVLYVILTFALGGGVYGLSSLTSVDLKSYAVLGVLVLSILIMEGVLWFVLHKKPAYSKETFDVSVKYKGKVVWLKGFYDSGNTLTDTLTGRPVVLLSKTAVDLIRHGDSVIYDGFVDVKTVNGESSMPIIELEEVRCGQNTYSCFGALTEQDMKGCDLILQNTLTYK